MTDTRSSKIANAIPALKSKWWTALLVVSLMANLLIAGAIGGRFARGHEFGQPKGSNFVQLIPRKFLDDLDGPRRRELMTMLRDNRDEFKQMRVSANAAALELAVALENPNYDSTAVQSVIEKFSTGRESLAAKGSAVVIDIIAKLSAEERKNLAAAIRDRSLHEVKH